MFLFNLEDASTLLDNMEALEGITWDTEAHRNLDRKNEFSLEEQNHPILSKHDYDDNIDVETSLPSINLPDDAKVLK